MRLPSRGIAWSVGLLLAGAVPLSAQQPGGGSPDRFLDVIVVLDPAFAPGRHRANERAASAIARGHGVRVAHAYGSAVFGFAGRVPEGRLNALERDPRVRYVDLDAPVAIPFPRAGAPRWCTPDSTHPACAGDGGGSDGGGTGDDIVPWGVDRIGAVGGATGAGVHVFVIDSGIDTNHPDLGPLGDSYAVQACKGGGCAAPWDDDHGHGTHVAGTVGARDNGTGVLGVAPGVILHAVKVLAKNGSGTRAGVIDGIDWVMQQAAALDGPVVANMSLGGPGSKTGSCLAGTFTGSDAYHQAICAAAAQGVIFAVAAGNDGSDAEGAVPAAYDDAVIAVSATAEGDDWPSWSNYGDGSALWDDDPSAPVGLAAPGVGVLSTQRGGGTTTMSGTSMAAPHVAGAIARWLETGSVARDFSAFEIVRNDLLVSAEETGGAFANTSGKPHAEDFLTAP